VGGHAGSRQKTKGLSGYVLDDDLDTLLRELSGGYLAHAFEKLAASGRITGQHRFGWLGPGAGAVEVARTRPTDFVGWLRADGRTAGDGRVTPTLSGPGPRLVWGAAPQGGFVGSVENDFEALAEWCVEYALGNPGAWAPATLLATGVSDGLQSVLHAAARGDLARRDDELERVRDQLSPLGYDLLSRGLRAWAEQP